ncbi:fused MFS/spermidine synthase [Nesterenkonia sp. E16_7]|uniref:spermidine synthase n=1 Tax=unclassified Nesterenkonia TaxID=2629769 RepID=UPI001A929CB7|nr:MULTISPECIES: fused MFS/spermidine synthase [unclassified Nesterenkonia]MBO0594448.1 fused MFS/spermidine synthase [Nesterenkonia sp. E16_10]MBO0598842.1 fused MFS/spermidine synthase [Nesterenkonia sp. E16_7]
MRQRERLGLPRSQRLSFSGQLAELVEDDLTEDGVVLSIGGAEQSHVELGDPDYLLHDYLFRMGAVLQTCARERLGRAASAGASAAGASSATAEVPRVLHLGAGALTLPRFIEHHWPAVEQTVVDIEPELVEFVLEHLPMRRSPRNLVADAAAVLGPGGALEGVSFDVVVVDLFNSAAAPEHLRSPEFHRAVLKQVVPGGLLLVNLGDEPPMDFVRAQVVSLLDAAALTAEASAASGAPEPSGTPETSGALGIEQAARCAMLSAPSDVLEARVEGNLSFAARRGAALEQTELNALWAAGPHPGDVLSAEELLDWARP